MADLYLDTNLCTNPFSAVFEQELTRVRLRLACFKTPPTTMKGKGCYLLELHTAKDPRNGFQ
jgi:hypothetical protein